MTGFRNHGQLFHRNLLTREIESLEYASLATQRGHKRRQRRGQTKRYEVSETDYLDGFSGCSKSISIRPCGLILVSDRLYGREAETSVASKTV